MVFHEITPAAIRARHRQPPRDRPPPGRRPGGPAHPRPPLRLRGVAGAVAQGAAASCRPAGSRASPPASSSSASGSACASSRASYWDLDGHVPSTAPADGERPSAPAWSPLDGARVATGKDFDAQGDLSRSGAVVLDEARRHAPWPPSSTAGPSPSPTSSPSRTAAARPPRSSPRRSSRRPAASCGSPPPRPCGRRRACTSSGYITYMRTDSTTLSDTALAAARSVVTRALRRRLPAARAPAVHQEGQERPGGPRGHPPCRRGVPASRRGRPRAVDADGRPASTS